MAGIQRRDHPRKTDTSRKEVFVDHLQVRVAHIITHSDIASITILNNPTIVGNMHTVITKKNIPIHK